MHSPRPILSLLLLLVVADHLVAGCTTPSLTQMASVPTGMNPMGAALADFDKDGFLDLATPQASGGYHVNVQRGNGNGTFQNGVPYGSGVEQSMRIYAADFNADTWPDLITVNYFTHNVSVLMNDGDGTFGPPLVTPTTDFPVRAFVGDANDDGILDLGIAGETAQIHYGNANGTFNPQTLPLPVGGRPYDIAFGDFNADGRADVAVTVEPIPNPGEAWQPSYILLHLRNANGSYSYSTLTLDGRTKGVLLVRDLNGDGAVELITANSWLMSISVFVNNNDGTLAPRVDYPVAEAVESLAAEDINEDGKRDLVIGAVAATSMVILTGRGDGSFDPTPYKQVITATSYYLSLYAVVTGDINGDFRPDVLMVDAARDVAYRFDNLCSPRWAGVILSSSPNPSSYGTSVELIANMDFRGATRPAGTISFYEGNALLATVTLSPTTSMASTFVLRPSLGTHQYTASYSGDATFGASSSRLLTHTVQRGPFGIPSDFTATGNQQPFSVTMQWIGTQDVQTYEISRMADGVWTVLGTTAFETYTDHTPPSLGSFFYRVRALGAGGAASGHAVDMASTVAFAHTIVPGQPIRAVDVTELREIVNGLRAAAAWPAFPFTDASLSGARIKAVHLTELRNALAQAMLTAGMGSASWSCGINPGQTVLANDLVEMRTKVR